PRGLFGLSLLYVAPVKIEQIQKGILVKLVLDVSIDHLSKEPLRLLPEAKGIQQPGAREPAANSHPGPRAGDEKARAVPIDLQGFPCLSDLDQTLYSKELGEQRQIRVFIGNQWAGMIERLQALGGLG